MQNVAYIHVKPNHQPFYVGKGTIKRAFLLTDRNEHHQNTVKKYGKENIKVGYIECSTEKIAFELEIGIIKCLRKQGVTLTNKTLGGEGIKGIPYSDKRRKQDSLRMKLLMQNPIRRAQSGSNKGKPHSEKTRKAISIANTKRVYTQETKDKISRSVKATGYTPSKEHVSKMNAASKYRNENSRWMNKEGEIKKVWKINIEEYLNEGWEIGTGKSKIKK